MRNLHIGLLASALLSATALSAQIKNFKFDVVTIGGQKLDQEAFRNGVLIVDFWGTWCPPCRKAIPDLVELYKKYKHHGLEIIGLNYREDGGVEAVRSFAHQQGITYPLAMGTDAIRDQVPDFGGYPTMLLFKKGLHHDQIKVGYEPGAGDSLEAWVRSALGLTKETGKKGGSEKEPEGTEPDEEEGPEGKEQVEPGRLFQPGNHDTGFAFKATDLDGKEFEFADLRGSKVLVAITSVTLEQQAAGTVELLNELSTQNKALIVVAACIEQGGDEQKVAAIRKFNNEHPMKYRAFPADIRFLRKLHRPGGLPTFLLFDEKGKLLLRQESDQPRGELRKRLQLGIDGRKEEPASRPTETRK